MSEGIGFFADEAFRDYPDPLTLAAGGSVEGPNIGPLQPLRSSAGDLLAQAFN